MGCHFLLQGIFPIWASNPHFLCLLCWQAGFFFFFTTEPPGKPLGRDTWFIPPKSPLYPRVAVAVQLLSLVQPFVTPYCSTPDFLSFTVSWSSLKLMSSQWYHPTISSSVFSFSSCPQSFPVSGSFPVSRLFTSGGKSSGASASASVLPMDVQGWFLLRLTDLLLGWTDLLAIPGTLKSCCC